MKNTRNISKVDPQMVALHGNYYYIKAVVQDLLDIIEKQNKLAREVMTLNPDYREIGEGKLKNLQELAKEVIWG
jgi:hypothetical protein